MVKKCIYCKCEIEENSVVDVCSRCGVGVWGEKMFRAIVSSMENARETGNLFQGSVTDTAELKAEDNRQRMNFKY
jgi:hypothetical protein